MKHYTIALYGLKICMKEGNQSLKYLKGD